MTYGIHPLGTAPASTELVWVTPHQMRAACQHVLRVQRQRLTNMPHGDKRDAVARSVAGLFRACNDELEPTKHGISARFGGRLYFWRHLDGKLLRPD